MLRLCDITNATAVAGIKAGGCCVGCSRLWWSLQLAQDDENCVAAETAWDVEGKLTALDESGFESPAEEQLKMLATLNLMWNLRKTLAGC